MHAIKDDLLEIDVQTRITGVKMPFLYNPGKINLQVWLGDDMYECTCVFPSVSYAVFEPNTEFSRITRRVVLGTEVQWSQDDPYKAVVGIRQIRLEPDEGIDCLYMDVEG